MLDEMPSSGAASSALPKHAKQAILSRPEGPPPAPPEVVPDGAPIAAVLFEAADFLSNEDVERYVTYLSSEGYEDAGSLRQARGHLHEWNQLKLTLRLKCALERFLQIVPASESAVPPPLAGPQHHGIDMATILAALEAKHTEQMVLIIRENSQTKNNQTVLVLPCAF